MLHLNIDSLEALVITSHVQEFLEYHVCDSREIAITLSCSNMFREKSVIPFLLLYGP